MLYFLTLSVILAIETNFTYQNSHYIFRSKLGSVLKIHNIERVWTNVNHGAQA
jgi:hypothetical protein